MDGQGLEGRVALVAGGAGQVGEGIVTAFLRRGATVVVPSRAAERLQALRGRVGPELAGRLVTVVGDVGAPGGAEAVLAQAREHVAAPLDVVVASLGGWWQGRHVVEVDLPTWRGLLDSLLTSHFLAARTFLPELLDRGTGCYVLVNGFSAEMPYPGAGPVSIAAAAQLMLARMLMTEHARSGVRIHSLVLGPVMTAARGGRGDPGWVTGDEVGEFAAYLASDAGSGRAGEIHRLMDRDALRAAYAGAGTETVAA